MVIVSQTSAIDSSTIVGSGCFETTKSGKLLGCLKPIWVLFWVLAVEVASGIEIFSKFEDLVVDVEDYVSLNLRDYYKIPYTFNCSSNLKIKSLITHEENGTDTDLGFNYGIVERASNKVGYETEIEHYVKFWNFTEHYWKNKTAFRRYCMNISVHNISFPDKPVEIDFSQDCQFVQIKVICKDKILDSVHHTIKSKRFLYNPSMKAEFALNFMNELPSALNYTYKCSVPPYTQASSDDPPPPAPPSPYLIPIAKRPAPHEPQALICKGEMKDYTDSLFGQQQNSFYYAVNDFLVEYNPDMSYLKIYDYEHVENRVQLEGFKIGQNCSNFRFFEYDDNGVLMVCTLESEIALNLFIFDAESKLMKHDNTTVPGRYDYCTFGHVAKFLSCRLLESEGKSTVGDIIRHFNVQIRPLLVVHKGDLTGKTFLEKYHRTLVGNQTMFQSVKFFLMEPCPKISTTLVINAELLNSEGVFLHTLHIDMKEMPSNFNILTVHLIGPKGNTPAENIRICGFKTNMIIANISSGVLYSDSSELSKLYFTRKYHIGTEFVTDQCFGESGYYAYVVGIRNQQNELVPKRIIIFNGNNIMNLNTRVFGVFDLPENHQKYIIKMSAKKRGIAVVTYNEGTGNSSGNNSRLIFQRFDYPSPSISTNYAGNYECVLNITEPQQLVLSGDSPTEPTVSADFKVSVHAWCPFTAKWARSALIEINRREQIQQIDLEEMLNMTGPLFSADLRLKLNTTRESEAVTLRPRYKTELYFSDEFGKSNFDDVLYISDDAIVVVVEGTLKLLTNTVQGKSQGLSVNGLQPTTANILDLELDQAFPGCKATFLSSVQLTFPEHSYIVNIGVLYRLHSETTDIADRLVLALLYVNTTDNRIVKSQAKPFTILMTLPHRDSDLEEPQMLVTNENQTNKQVHVNSTADEKRIFWAFLTENRTVLTTHGASVYIPKDSEFPVPVIDEPVQLYFNLTLDKYNMRNPYFRVQKFRLTYYLNESGSEKFFMHVLSSDALMLMSMCPDGLSQTIRFVNFNLGQLGDMVSTFACSIVANRCIMSLKGGSIIVLNLTYESKHWKLVPLDQTYIL